MQEFRVHLRGQTQGDNRAQTEIFADFCRFSPFQETKHLGNADFCTKPQIFTGNIRGHHGGGGKRRGVENLTNDTPPKKGFWTPPRTVRFPPPSGVSALFFLYKNPRQSGPEALLEGSKNFRESAFSGTFSSPHTFCTPPYHGPRNSRKPQEPAGNRRLAFVPLGSST